MLEWMLFVTNIMGAVAIVAGALVGLSGYISVQILLIPVGILMYFLSFVAIFFDIRKIKREVGEDLDWRPSTILYLIGVLFFSLIAVLQYLYVRHEKTSMTTPSSKWVYGIISTFFIGLGGIIVGALANLNQLVAISAGVFLLHPITVYKDAAHVQSLNLEWKPNPVTYYIFTIIPLFTVVVTPYYLYKRNKETSIGGEDTFTENTKKRDQV